MDIQIRKYIQYKVRTLNKRKLELMQLKEEREKARAEILETMATPNLDGMPHGKGNVGDPTQAKAIKLEEIDRRIGVLENEVKKFTEIEEKIHLMGRTAEGVYKGTIVKDLNAEYIAMECGLSRRSLFYMKAGLLRFIAKELGEYLDLDEKE